MFFSCDTLFWIQASATITTTRRIALPHGLPSPLAEITSLVSIGCSMFLSGNIWLLHSLLCLNQVSHCTSVRQQHSGFVRQGHSRFSTLDFPPDHECFGIPDLHRKSPGTSNKWPTRSACSSQWPARCSYGLMGMHRNQYCLHCSIFHFQRAGKIA